MKRSKTVKFSSLTKAQKRVAIAKDVISQIKARKFDIQTGIWAETEIETPHFPESREVDQEVLLHGIPPIQPILHCRCCAVGAAFLSSIRLDNVATATGSNDKADAWRQLSKYFSNEQLSAIEQAFETGSGSCGCGDESAVEFGSKYDDDYDRALAIFGNIVRNKGVFKP